MQIRPKDACINYVLRLNIRFLQISTMVEDALPRITQTLIHKTRRDDPFEITTG